MATLAQLGYESTLGSLACHDFKIQPDEPGQAIAKAFEKYSDLPGVLILEGDQILGMVSRRKFLERMSLPYGLELYLKRPVRVLLKFIQGDSLQLSSDCKVNKAVQLALKRPADMVYEPIIVLFEEDNRIGLLDFQKLLLAQSKILVLANNVMKEQRSQIRQYLEHLEREKSKAQQYAQMLERQQVEIRGRNQLLDSQKIELEQQAKDISDLNQRFIEIGRLLSRDGKRAFQATFAGSDQICRTTNQIVRIGNDLTMEVDKVQAASKLISTISRQVHHLAVRAALVVNQLGVEGSGFSHIASEISQLVGQTFEAGRQVEDMATHFRANIQDLTHEAKQGSSVAQSLSEKIRLVEGALTELEALVQSQFLTPEPDLAEHLSLALANLALAKEGIPVPA